MYYYLHGMITFHIEDKIVVECSGVGYDVLVSHTDDFPIGETLFVYVCHIQNENESYFVGFKTMEEKKMFLSLTSVKGIGPKTALQALSATSVERLANAIDHSDSAFLMRLPGIGKKSASQLILDLKGKLMLFDGSAKTLNKEMDVAKEGLKSLGFKESEINKALASINETNLSAQDYMKVALQLLNKK
jgi:holliday junction DNA helicase RuvA